MNSTRNDGSFAYRRLKSSNPIASTVVVGDAHTAGTGLRDVNGRRGHQPEQRLRIAFGHQTLQSIEQRGEPLFPGVEKRAQRYSEPITSPSAPDESVSAIGRR
jgi:hypothetical protein